MKRLQRCFSWRCLRFFLCLVVSLNIFLALPVSASDYDDITEVFGITWEELEEMTDENGVFSFPLPDVYSTYDYAVEENISLSEGGIVGNYVNANGTGSLTKPFGYTYGITNVAQMLTLTLYNNGSPLFSSGGTLNLHVITYAETITMYVYFADGSSYSETLNFTAVNSASYVELTINNTYANINKIQFVYADGLLQSNGDYVICGGIEKYGYLLSEENTITETETTKNIFELLASFVGNFWGNVVASMENFWSSFMSDVSASITKLNTKSQAIYDIFRLESSNFWTFLGNKLGEMVASIGNLFIPDSEFLEEWTQDIHTMVVDKLGAVGWFAGYFTNFFNDILSSGYGEPILNIPEIKLDIPNYGSFVLLEATEYNFNSVYEHFEFLEPILKFATGLVLTGLFIFYLQHAFKEIFGS